MNDVTVNVRKSRHILYMYVASGVNTHTTLHFSRNVSDVT